MDHRMKNLFALAGSLVGMSVRDAASPQELASIVQERLSALARAHALTMPKDSAAGSNDSVRLHVLLRTILAPYEGAGGGDRSEEHTSELQSLMRHSYAVFCL